MVRKHDKARKRERGAQRPTERRALELQGYSKNVVTRLTRALKSSPDPEEELRDLVLDCLTGNTKLPDLVAASRAAGMYGKLRTQLAEFHLHLVEGSKDSLQIVDRDSPKIPKSRPGTSEMGTAWSDSFLW